MPILSDNEIAGFLDRCPNESRDLVLDLRKFVLKNAPGVVEAIKFNSLCYFKPNQPYGSIGGNVCMISVLDDGVQLAFIHGASLPDPDKILHGRAKAKRYVKIRKTAELQQPALQDLVQAAMAYSPI